MSLTKQPSLIFIPDISGFTNFVQHTAVEHSQHIIAELLELLMDSDQLGMTLAEIEGDALFYYKENSIPSKAAIMQQVEHMFIRFHSRLIAYDKQRICQCGACRSASNLDLKFIIHGGEMDFIQLKGQKKAFGQTVIVAHRLMKNNVPIDDYALLSEDLEKLLEQDNALGLKAELIPTKGQSQYDLGLMNYNYFSLKPLRAFVKPINYSHPAERVAQPWKEVLQIQSPVEELYDLVSDFDKRLLWNKMITNLEYEKEKINRVGTEHECVVNNMNMNFKTVTDDFDGKIVYGERSTNAPMLDALNIYFILEPIDKNQTQLTVEMHPYTTSFFGKMIVPLMKWMFGREYTRQLARLKMIAEGGGAGVLNSRV